MRNLRELYRPFRNVLNGKRRVFKIALVLGITLYVFIDSIRMNNNVVDFRHRLLCSYTMHRGGNLQLRNLYSESGCATMWPEGKKFLNAMHFLQQDRNQYVNAVFCHSL